MEADSDDKKPCPVCGEKIARAAHKCVECDSYLDWRRYVNVSSSVVSLLIALISVMALSVQHIKGVFDKGHSNVRVAVVRTSPGMISLLAFNDGNRPGAVSPAEFDVYDSRVGNVQYMMVPKDGAFIVEPGKAKQIDLVFQEKNVEEKHRDWIKEDTVRNNMEPDANFETGLQNPDRVDPAWQISSVLRQGGRTTLAGGS
jgi:hypothetical protein